MFTKNIARPVKRCPNLSVVSAKEGSAKRIYTNAGKLVAKI